MYANNRTRRKWNQVLLFLVSCHFVKYSISSPIFSSQFSQFQAARNIRNLPCVVRKSGLKGVCMFAIDCIKTNGTHLGTCIDKFYFGSCCQMKDVDSIYNPEISDNRIDTSFPASSSYNTNAISEKPFIPVSSSTSLSTSVSHITSNYKTTSKPAINYNNKTFELVPTTSSSSRKPTASTTERYTVHVGGFTTTLGTIIQKNVSTSISLNDETASTTEGIKLTTFQSVQSSKHGNDAAASSSSFTTTTTAAKATTKQPTTTAQRTKKPNNTKPTNSTKKPVSSQAFNRTSVASDDVATSVRPTRRPVTQKPSNTATSTVIKSTRKPVAPTNVTVNRRPIITSRRNATLTTRKAASTSTTMKTTEQQSASASTTPAVLTTISFVEATKAPRPRPTPTDYIVKVESTTISSEDMLVTSFYVESEDKTSSTEATKLPTTTTSKPTMSTSTVKSTSVTRRTTKRPNTTATTNKKPITEPSSTSTLITTTRTTTKSDSSLITRDETTTRPFNSTTTVKTVEIPTTSSHGLVTWTLSNDVIDNTTKSDSWILVPSVTPSDVKTSSQSSLDTTIETKTIQATPLITPSTTSSDNITNEIETDDVGKTSTEKIEETTVDPTSSEEQEDSSEYVGVENSSEESIEIDEDEDAATAAATTQQIENEIETETESESETINYDFNESTLSESTSSSSSSSSSSSTPTTTASPAVSSATELSPDESLPAQNPDDTTMWPVTQRTNETEEVTSFESLTEENSSRLNETSTLSPTSSTSSLEGVDYKLICGKRMFPEPRIVGGSKASFGRWPWQISLRQWRTSTYLHKCGSALLNENWAISAAHCVDNVPPSDLLLRLGEYDLSIEEEPYGYQERRVQIVASHPQFDPRTFEYDLALLRFYEPVIFQPNIIPVCVPEKDEDFIGRTAYVTGWGRLYEDGPLPSVLQEVTVPVIKNDICESMYRNAGYIEHIPHIFICAGHKAGSKDSCEGDSGGPMVIQREDKRFQLAGIISWGIGCAEPNQPGVYTRISEFRDWINQILMF